MTHPTILSRNMSFNKFMPEVTGLELNVSVTVTKVSANVEKELRVLS